MLSDICRRCSSSAIKTSYGEAWRLGRLQGAGGGIGIILPHRDPEASLRTWRAPTSLASIQSLSSSAPSCSVPLGRVEDAKLKHVRELCGVFSLDTFQSFWMWPGPQLWVAVLGQSGTRCTQRRFQPQPCCGFVLVQQSTWLWGFCPSLQTHGMLLQTISAGGSGLRNQESKFFSSLDSELDSVPSPKQMKLSKKCQHYDCMIGLGLVSFMHAFA